VEVTVGLTPTYATFLDYNLGSLSAGTHTLKIKTDSSGVIAESNETDNEFTKTVTVLPQNTPPAISVQPADQTVSVGMNVTFLVAASGNPAPRLTNGKAGGGHGRVRQFDGGRQLYGNSDRLSDGERGNCRHEWRSVPVRVSNGVSPNANSNVVTLTVNRLHRSPAPIVQPLWRAKQAALP